ncbi:MAG TPA: hypothetical protein VGQ57_13340 [Polyangiaceae bacterium]|jgi:hypothetical protein|nr:hypothetical protein [Polyangiaceae bacterium]
MYEPWIFATTLAAGGGLVAYALALEPQQTGLPSIAPRPAAAVHVIPPAPPTPVVEPPAPVSRVVVLEPVVIQARLHPAKAIPKAVPTEGVAEPKPDIPANHPCSDWRDIGPTHVVSGQPSGDLAVRSLCP